MTEHFVCGRREKYASTAIPYDCRVLSALWIEHRVEGCNRDDKEYTSHQTWSISYRLSSLLSFRCSYSVWKISLTFCSFFFLLRFGLSFFFCAEKAIKFNLFNVRFYHLAVSAFCSFHKKNGHLMQYNNFVYKYLTWFACSWHQSQVKWPEKAGQIKIRGKEHVKKLTSIQVDS